MEQFISTAFNADFTKHYSLFIEIEMQQVAFILYDTQSGNIDVLKRIPIAQSIGSAEFITALKTIVTNEDMLHLPVSEIKISISINTFTLVPRALYEDEMKGAYLKFTTSDLQKEVIEVNSVKAFFIKNIFLFETTLKNYLMQAFPSAKIYHTSTALLQYAALNKDDLHTQHIIIDVRQEKFYIIIMHAHALQFCNQFTYTNKEDFLYFVLLVCDQLNIDRNACTLQLSGYITIDSQLYNELYKFFRNISFASSQEHVNSNSLDESIALHYYNTLLNLHVCE